MAKEENEKEKNKPKPCPKWLNDTAKKEWRRVAKILAEEGKDFTDKDLKALEAYCINYAKWQRCEQIIDEKLSLHGLAKSRSIRKYRKQQAKQDTNKKRGCQNLTPFTERAIL